MNIVTLHIGDIIKHRSNGTIYTVRIMDDDDHIYLSDKVGGRYTLPYLKRMYYLVSSNHELYPIY